MEKYRKIKAEIVADKDNWVLIPFENNAIAALDIDVDIYDFGYHYFNDWSDKKGLVFFVFIRDKRNNLAFSNGFDHEPTLDEIRERLLKGISDIEHRIDIWNKNKKISYKGYTERRHLIWV